MSISWKAMATATTVIFAKLVVLRVKLIMRLAVTVKSVDAEASLAIAILLAVTAVDAIVAEAVLSLPLKRVAIPATPMVADAARARTRALAVSAVWLIEDKASLINPRLLVV